MRYLIINSDDFGFSPRVNAAVLRAHHQGVLTSASLMVAEEGFQQAVELARKTPTLGVGLHLTVSCDHALLPAAEIPHLVDASHRFESDPFRVSMRYFFLRTVQRELRREMAAQFERFAETGLPWSHVDGHQHMHMVPTVWDTMLEMCDLHGIHRIRIPQEQMRAHFRSGGDGFSLNTVATLLLRVMRRHCLRTLRERRKQGKPAIFVCERVYGQLQTGNMNTEYLLNLLPRLTGRANEIYFHPGAPHARPLPTGQRADGIEDVELKALLDPRVSALIKQLDLCVGRYEDIDKPEFDRRDINKSGTGKL